MLPLAKLAKVVGGELYRAAGSEVVTGVSYNSRRVQPGDVFIADLAKVLVEGMAK